MGNENDNSNNNNSDWVSNTSKINDLRSGAGTGFKKAGGTFRFTHNGHFSPKHYQSGWNGGSRARIKTHNSIKIGGAASKFSKTVGLVCTGINLRRAYTEDGGHMGNNFKKTVCSEAGSWAGSVSGAATGAAIGSSCAPGVGTVIGGIIGGVAGGIGGGKGGEKIGNKLFGN